MWLIVTLLIFLDKVIEKLVTDLPQVFLDNSPALDPFQSGFRTGYGTETALVVSLLTA